MISLTSDVMEELLPWTDKMDPLGTDFSRCFEGEEGHEKLAHPELDSALGKEGPQLEAEEAMSQVLLWALGPTPCVLIVSVWFRGEWGTQSMDGIRRSSPTAVDIWFSPTFDLSPPKEQSPPPTERAENTRHLLFPAMLEVECGETHRPCVREGRIYV